LCFGTRSCRASLCAGNPNVEGLNEYLVTSYLAATSRQVTKAMALALSQKARPTSPLTRSRFAKYRLRRSGSRRLAAAAQEAAGAEMRRVRAARRGAALRVALAAVREHAAGGAAASAGADDAADPDALVERLLRDGEAAQPSWPPSERARLMRARQWTCLLARDAEGALLGWCGLLRYCPIALCYAHSGWL
jgi:hypothetical protein